MARAKIELTHPDVNSGNPVSVLASSVIVSGQANVQSKPYVNGTAPSQVHKQTTENLQYVMNGVHYTGTPGTLNYSDVLTLYNADFDGTNPINLDITFGTTNQVLANLPAETSTTNTGGEVLKTFTLSGVYVGSVSGLLKNDGGVSTDLVVEFTYSDATTASATPTISTTTSYSRFSVSNPNTDKLVSSITIEVVPTSGESFLKSALVTGTTQTLPNQSGVTTGIKCLLKSFNLPLSATDTEGAYLPVLQLTFVETDSD